MTLATDHMEVSRRFIRQAQEELANGDFLQASEKAWGAAARALKAVAEREGLRHQSHRDLVLVIGFLVDTTGQQELRRGFQVAESLHANFYESWMSENLVRSSIFDVVQLVTRLENLTTDDSQEQNE